MSAGLERILTLRFSGNENETNYFGHGWSRDAAGCYWMTGEASALWLDNPGPDHDLILELEFSSLPRPSGKMDQSLAVAVRNAVIAEISVTERGTVGFHIPAALVRMPGPVQILFQRNDHHQPVDFGQQADERPTPLAVMGIRLARILPRPPPSGAPSLSPDQMISRFESLGDNCEFGFVHRRMGAEPLGLLRFASIPLAQLLRGFRTGFEGLGDPQATIVVVEGGSEYVVKERGYQISYHTHLREHETTAEAVHRQQQARLHFLRRKLLEDVASGEKIFVIKRTPNLRFEEILPLYVALNELGQTQLLWVVAADETHKPGTVESVLPGLLRGHVDWFASWVDANELSFPAWTVVCQAAWRMVGGDLGDHGPPNQEKRDMPETSGDQPVLPGSEPSAADMAGGGQKACQPVARTDAVRFTYQLLLGREPENEDVLIGQSNFESIYHLRNRFMNGEEFQNQHRFIRMAELMYTDAEAAAKADTERFDAFLGLEPDLEARIREVVQGEAVSDDIELNQYTSYHGQRFFDQVRLVVAIRRKLLGHISRPRVLEVGASPVTRMYGRLLDDIDLYTADLPSAEPVETIARRFSSKEHYYVDLDTGALSETHPHLTEQRFNIILFCEVIEHVLASPEEMISDLLKLLAPGGVLIVTTPNGMSSRRLFEIVVGRKGDSIYRRNARDMHQHHHIHVREYTLKEIRNACTACDAKVLLQAVKNYYSDPIRDFVAMKYVSAGEVQITLVSG